MTADEARTALRDAYVARFGEPPTSVAEIAIECSLHRVVNGERFEWVVDGPHWRRLNFLS